MRRAGLDAGAVSVCGRLGGYLRAPAEDIALMSDEERRGLPCARAMGYDGTTVTVRRKPRCGPGGARAIHVPAWSVAHLVK